MTGQQLKWLSGSFAIHQFDAPADIPAILLSAVPCWIARTADELSVVCHEMIGLVGAKAERGWSCLEVIGPFDLTTTIGVLASLTLPLADAKISVFALSTFNTDYLLVKTENRAAAIAALELAGHRIIP